MIQTFRDAATQDIFKGENTKHARKAFPRELWSLMRRKLDMLQAATKIRDLGAIPGNRFEDLKYTKPGYYSIRVNDRFRVTFQFRDGHVYDAGIEDYHVG